VFINLAILATLYHSLPVQSGLATKTIEFGNLLDVNRNDRKVPIKIHLPIQKGKYPLVILSHGGGGHWDANFAQAKNLASHGYVVACPEHVGSNKDVLKKNFQFKKNLVAMTRDADEVLTRPKDISFAIDHILATPALRASVDPDRIGMMGHSFGAYTTLTICGARPALDWLTPTVGSGNGLGPNLRDKRVKCGVALSPQGPGEPFFLASSFRSIATPLLGISGSDDQTQGPDPEVRKQGFALWPSQDKFLIWIANADHNAFSDSTGTGSVMLKSKSRNDVQPLSREATYLFFDAYLKADRNAKAKLSESYLKGFCRGVASKVEVMTK
jgi:predicted dienelactone hydrolase